MASMYQNSQEFFNGTITALSDKPINVNGIVPFTRRSDEPGQFNGVIETFYASTPGCQIVSIAENPNFVPPVGGISINGYLLNVIGYNSDTVIYRCLQPIESGNNEGLYPMGAVGPEVLWTNPSPSSSFGAQTITLSKGLSSFRYCEILWLASKNAINFLPSTIISSGNGGYGINATDVIRRRGVDYVSNTQLAFTVCSKWATYGGSATNDNNYVIPYQVIGIL